MSFTQDIKSNTICKTCFSDSTTGLKHPVHVCQSPQPAKCIHDRQMRVIWLLSWVVMASLAYNMYVTWKLDPATVCLNTLMGN